MFRVEILGSKNRRPKCEIRHSAPKIGLDTRNAALVVSAVAGKEQSLDVTASNRAWVLKEVYLALVEVNHSLYRLGQSTFGEI